MTRIMNAQKQPGAAEAHVGAVSLQTNFIGDIRVIRG
jgi:hypothetical protein